MSEASGCANCGLAVAGPEQKFCPACGQPTPVHRVDWHFMLHELEHSVLHMDRGILYSIRELMVRPGRLMRDYLEGRRAHQVKPFLLLMVTAAGVLFLAKLLLGGDLIVAIEGKRVEDMQDLSDIMNNYKAGDAVTVTVFRGRRKMDFRVVLGEMREAERTQRRAIG